MPEHDTFDLDAAFHALERDIAGSSVPRGAGAAIATARRRRRTTIGAAAAAVLAVGAVAVSQGLADHPSTIGPSDRLPAPAPLTAHALTTATNGWAGPWSSDHLAGTTHQLDQAFAVRCLAHVDPGQGQPRGSGDLVFSAPDSHSSAFAELADFGPATGDAGRTWTALTSAFGTCPGSAQAFQLSSSVAEGVGYTLRGPHGDGVPEQVWLVREANAVAALWVVGPDRVATGAAQAQVMNALLAALQAPESYQGTTGVHAGASPSAGPGGYVGESDFAAALGGWASGWSADRANRTTDALPCGVQASRSTFGTGTSLGADGSQQTLGFDTADAAAQGLSRILTDLGRCPTATYAVSTVALPGGASVGVAASTDPNASVVWLVRQGREVLAVTIPAGDTTPPDSVSEAVGSLMLQGLTSGGPGAVESAGPPATAPSSP